MSRSPLYPQHLAQWHPVVLNKPLAKDELNILINAPGQTQRARQDRLSSLSPEPQKPLCRLADGVHGCIVLGDVCTTDGGLGGCSR